MWLPRKCDYRTHTHLERQAGQSHPFVPLCFTGDTKSILKPGSWSSFDAKNQGVFVKHYAPCGNKVQKAIFNFKVTRSLTLMSYESVISGVCMPNMKSLSLRVQKLQRRLKLTTDKQTGQKQYAPDHSIRGHKNILICGTWSSCYPESSMTHGWGQVIIQTRGATVTGWACLS